jgi:hypothetical protein
VIQVMGGPERMVGRRMGISSKIRSTPPEKQPTREPLPAADDGQCTREWEGGWAHEYAQRARSVFLRVEEADRGPLVMYTFGNA